MNDGNGDDDGSVADAAVNMTQFHFKSKIEWNKKKTQAHTHTHVRSQRFQSIRFDELLNSEMSKSFVEF